MSSEREIKPLSASELRGPEQHFEAYCEAERVRRCNGEAPFDEARFKEAVDLALRKLRSRKEGGAA